jgi:hypothetical protein
MQPEIIFNELTPYLQEAFKYVAGAAAGGVIGNRVDSWFMSLFYYQRKNITQWLSSWHPSIEDLKLISKNEPVRMLFSKAFHDISQETFEKKLILWPQVTNSIVRNHQVPFDKKQYFTQVYSSLHTYSLKYLATLSQQGLLFAEVFGDKGDFPSEDSDRFQHYLGQMQCLSLGFTMMDNTGFILSPLGKDFIDFISDHSWKKLQDLMGLN